MANANILVQKTIQYKDSKGKSVTVLPDDEPQSVPADIAKEAVERGLAKKPAKSAPATDDQDPGQGDG